MPKLQLQDLELKGRKVLIRVDFNVPLDDSGCISDDTRLKESLPCIQYVIKSGGKAILMSHLDRPKGFDARFSLRPCAVALCKLLGQPVLMADDCIGEKVEKMVSDLKPGQVLLLENLRFYPAEENPSSDPSFAQKLASLGDVYVNDAFATAHRSHSSTASIALFFPGKAAAGLLLQKEIHFLDALLLNPKRPFYAIIGGSKISSKMGVLRSLLAKADAMFVGGGMVFTLLKAKGIAIGNSIHEEDQIPVARQLMEDSSRRKGSLWMPSDLLIANAFKNDADCRQVLTADGVPDGWQGMDIGPKTVQEWKKALETAATVFWNGPLGVFEFPRFALGTEQIAKTLSFLNAVTVVGGGDSVAAINQLGLSSKFTHLSTGGGASLEYIEFGHLPGIDALSPG